MNAIPAVVAKVFETHSVDYASMSQTRIFQYMHNLSVSKTPQNSQTKSAPVVQIVFLEDENGRAQVLIPRDRLLDLSSMSNRLGRQFKAMQPKDMDAFKLKYNVSDMPPIPEITELETFVDRSLLTHHFLYIFSGTQDHWLKISNKSFTHLINGANIGVFAVSAPRLEPFDSQSMQILADESDLQDDIKDINHAVERFTARRIHQRLEETLDLPPLPETARRIVEIRIDPDADTLQLATAVEFDPTLSAQVMSWARSPYYASRDIATDIQSAVLRVLGFDLVVNLALGLSLGRALTLPKDGPHGYTPFWQQAVVTATLCNELART
ncbi:MAG: HDOD domain-containing protein, partial [Oleibacter sp.]|nr:HDOD domain-containing protein [Thalassolituus sp.]